MTDGPEDTAIPEPDFARVQAALEGRWPESAIKPSLEREAALMDLLGSPQDSAPVVHIAGTNGKTSTTRMIDSLLRAADLRTGMYTSPHLHLPNERISIDGEPIDEEAFVRCFDDIAPYLQLIDERVGALTWFEVLTAMAFAAFADAPVEAMAIECGMGGTWDATNVVSPSTCVITPIGMDHSDYLGDTLAQIAAEKAGIITAAVPVLTARQDPEAQEVLAGAAQSAGAQLLVAGEDFSVVGRELAVGGQLLDIETPARTYSEVFVPLFGRHQAENAALAVAAAESFLGGRGLDEQLVRDGLAQSSSPGRIEILRTAPTVLADAAHNVPGMRSLVHAVGESFGFARVVPVVAILGDKDAMTMLSVLAELADEVIVTQNSSPRCLPAHELADIARTVWDDDQVRVEASLADALEIAVSMADEEIPGQAGVLVTGSVVTVADAGRLMGRH